MTKANEIQVGGTHYRTGYQHWDLIINTGMAYLEAQATRYIVRWRKKDGLQDLQKALHYINKLDEAASVGLVCSPLAATNEVRPSIVKEVAKFAAANNLSDLEKTLVLNIALWESKEDVNGIRELLLQLMEEAQQQSFEVPEPVPASDSNKHADHVTFPMPGVCPHCDFGTGQRGMDSCGKCQGTGSIFRVKGKLYPNTEDGYKRAFAALNEGKPG